MPVEAVIFDMDGVLIDTEQVWDEVREQYTKESGGTWLAEAQQAMMGMSSNEWSRYMAQTLKVPFAPDVINEAVVSRLLARYAEDLPVLPGAVDTVRTLSEEWPMAIASSSNRELIVQVLEIMQLTDCFDAVVSSEEVDSGKPDPAVYLEAADRLDVTPTDCVAIEDSSNGLRAAASAGMKVVAVPNAHYPPAADALAVANLQVESLDELSVSILRDLN